MIIDHVQLAMPAGQEDEARSFYGRILGMVEEEKPEGLSSRGGCWFRLDRCVVHVGVDPDFVPQKKAHPAFLVEDLGALAARLESSGSGVAWDDAVPNVDRFYSNDPFGNRLEFVRRGNGFSER